MTRRLSPHDTSKRKEFYYISKWNEFYTRAKAFRNPESSDDTILDSIEKVNPFGFPKDDLELGAACEGLSNAL